MKLIYISFLIVVALSASHSTIAQNKIDTTTFKVAGVCEMCKERIENASLINGVKFTEWNKESKFLTVIYKPEKVTVEDLHKAVAEYGHDTEKVKSEKKAYEKLPFCCEYRGGLKTH